MATLPPPLKTSVREDEVPTYDPQVLERRDQPAYPDLFKSFVSTASGKMTGLVVLAFGMIWFLFGAAGFIMSFICFGYTGTIGEKLLGLILAIGLGPFYWLYYYSSPSYCKANPPSFF